MMIGMTVMSLLCTAPGARANDKGMVRFGIDPNYPPMEAKAPDGSIRGFDVDLGDEICKRIRAHCKWVELEFSGMIPALQARKIDAILSSMAITEKRAQQIAFSSKLYQFRSRIVARNGAGLGSDTRSLSGKRIGVQSGTQFESYALAQWVPHGVIVVAYKGQDEVFADLVNGRIDGALLGTVEADQGFLSTPRGKGFGFAGPALSMGDKGVGIGMRKSDLALRESIDAAIASMLADGTYTRIARRYFSFDTYGD
ncbi:ABC transporter substrate-binding protein [Burkholderia stagnalis]|uniref:transporter substrate-binding domain-containing protein n=1 Tax=Burkholderia stagnalis TaxID=1503054 RepID=UPI00075CE455|nr:ABC transporter substrate-binding protein [Burkholderia stagnalis]KVN27283.1 ABC transporter substrate-binding protein [Burkholderia stagnalis]KVN80426.1 ABC transporter substrate-binding protein [Burkholderia stagnalis]KWO27542.1 ABC transporter substrate-binding protein [Burkholderia stagnalis]KWO43321.1 ABC transporter substrate-binding protein [Burkholderia stagnalis]